MLNTEKLGCFLVMTNDLRSNSKTDTQAGISVCYSSNFRPICETQH